MTRKRKIVWVLGAAIYLALQVWFLQIQLRYPYFGIIVKVNEYHEVYVDHVDKGGKSLPLNIKAGDVITKIDDHSPLRTETIRWGQLEQFHRLDLMRNGVPLTVQATGLYSLGEIDLFVLPGAVLSLLLAAFFYMELRKSNAGRFLAFNILLLSFIFSTLGANYRGDTLAKAGTLSVLATLPFLFLDFLVRFFREKGFGTLLSFPFKFCYGILVCFFIVLFPLSEFSEIARFDHRFGEIISVVFLLIGFLFDLFVIGLVSFRFRRKISYERTLIELIWISLVISFSPVVMLSLIPLTVIGRAWINPLITGWFLLFFPASFAYLIASKQLYDIHLVLRRLLVAAIVSLLPSFLLVGIVLGLFPEAPHGRLMATFLLAMAFFTCLLYALEYFTTALEPMMFPRRHQLKVALDKMAAQLPSVSTVRDLKEIVLADLVATLHVRGGAIVYVYPRSTEAITVGELGEEEAGRLARKEQPDEPFHYSMMISRNEEYTAYLVLTRKKTNTLPGLEELNWLKLIMTYLAVSLENIHLVRKLTLKLEQLAARMPGEEEASDLSWFRKLMFELQEKERTRIASDLHDTTMQDLFFMKRRLVTMLDHRAIPAETVAELEQLIEFIDIVHMSLRENCYELHPHLIKESGLIPALQKLFEQEQNTEGVEYRFHAEGNEEIEQLHLEHKRHVFRIVQELLNNAKKHAQASRVGVKLCAAEGEIRLSYEDDGVGFDPGKEHAGIGLRQIQSRVHSLNGTYHLSSGPSGGVNYEMVVRGILVETAGDLKVEIE